MRTLKLMLAICLTLTISPDWAQAQTPITARAAPAALYMLGSQGDDFLYQFAVDRELQVRPEPAPTVVSGKGVLSFAATEDGRNLYVANYLDNTISQYTVGRSGALSMHRPPAVDAHQVDIVVTDPDDRYLFALQSEQGQITAFRIGADGRLTSARSSKVQVRIPLNIVIDPTGRYVYVIGELGTDPPGGAREIDEFKIGAGGSLTPLMPAHVDDFGGFGAQMFTRSNGSNLYVADGVGISQYKIQSNGQLKYIPGKNYSSPPEVMAAIDERYHMIIGIGGDDPERGESASQIILNAVMPGGKLLTRNVYDIDRFGALSQPEYPPPQAVPPLTPNATPNPSDEVLPEPTCVAIDQQDQILYVLDARSYDIFRYSIDPGGSLNQLMPSIVSGHTPQPPDTPILVNSSSYFPPTINYVLVVRRVGML